MPLRLPEQLSETPFDSTGRCRSGAQFVYMTGPGTFSWLLPPGPQAVVLRGAQESIPMGYTQLWLLEKRFAAHPPAGAAPLPAAERPAPPSLDRARWPGRLLVLLEEGDGDRCRVVSYHEKEDVAARIARKHARQRGRRVVLGRLVADVYWH